MPNAWIICIHILSVFSPKSLLSSLVEWHGTVSTKSMVEIKCLDIKIDGLKQKRVLSYMGPTQILPHFLIMLKANTYPRQVLTWDSSSQLKSVLFLFPLCIQIVRSSPKPYKWKEKYSLMTGVYKTKFIVYFTIGWRLFTLCLGMQQFFCCKRRPSGCEWGIYRCI